METLTLNVRVDANDKKYFEQFCNDVGMNISTAINMFIKAVLREQKLPFEIKSNTLDEIIYEKLREAELEMENTSKRYSIDDIERSMNRIIKNTNPLPIQEGLLHLFCFIAFVRLGSHSGQYLSEVCHTLENIGIRAGVLIYYLCCCTGL